MTIKVDSDFLTLIPARGGSKGLPRKNMLPLAGVPLLGWSIRQVIQSEVQTRLVVTTDDPEIAEYAGSLGAEIVDRPRDLASDTATSESALLHALDTLVGADMHSHIIFLQATSPIRLRGSLDRAVNQYRRLGSDSVVSVVPQSPFLWVSRDGAPHAFYEVGKRQRRQDFDTEGRLFRESGSIYITGKASLLETSNRISGNVSLFEMSEIEGIDIDTELDLRIAESIMCILLESGDFTE